MEPFIVNNVIDDIDCLYGRSKSIETLVSCAKRRENAGIIGARRFGKTCLLKSMLSFLEIHPEYNALPIFFDVKDDTNIHKNTPEVYYTLAALLAKKMCETGILEEGNYKISRRCVLDVTTDLSDMIVQMSSWHPEYQKQAFFNLTDEVSKKGKYVLLLFDEIDSLLLDALESPSDFGRIRGAATDKSGKLAFWIAGTSTWKSITTSIGSPELNCGLKQIRLSSLEKDDFTAMWEYECSLIKDKELSKKILSLGDDIYIKTGGVPYYAKFIGSSFMNGTITEMPDYSILRDYLMSIYESRFMTETERSALKLLAKGPIAFEDSLPDGVNSIYLRGLVEVNDNEQYYIAIQYLTDYVNAICSNSIIEEMPDIEKMERDILVDEIVRLRDSVNKSYRDNPPFLTSTEDPIDINNLRVLCCDESMLFAFATSLCKLYYEGSDTGTRLPSGFKKRDFLQMIRALRNKCDHRECKPTQMEDKKLYAMINNGYPPITSEHFKTIQSNVLRLFKDELLLMLQKDRSVGRRAHSSQSPKNDPKRPTQPEKETSSKNKKMEENAPQRSSLPKLLEEGKYYEGIIVKVSNSKGTSLNVECVFCNFPLPIQSQTEEVNEGDKVLFKATSKPNLKDPSKLFWMADEVHKK